MTTTRRLLAIVAALAFVAVACGSDGDGGSGSGGDAGAPAEPTCDATGTLNVPDDYDTIQAAADAAGPGALVLVAAGTYEEAVNVTCDDVTIRGVDRNDVVLEGGFELENGVRILEADGVVVENMTAQNYTGNGFFWTGVDGYRGSYLTAIRNGDYGVYAFGSVNGLLEHSYGSGSPDAGVYIGQCGTCNAIVDDFVSEWNGLGYSGTNSSDVTIVNSTFRHNRSGIVPNAGSYEGCAPPVTNTIVGNLVHDNGNSDTASIGVAVDFEGTGLLIAGTHDSVIERNRAQGNPAAGVAIVPVPEDDPIGPLIDAPDPDCVEDSVALSDEELADIPNPLVWPSFRNRVVDNVVTDNGANGGWDLVLLQLGENENCFSDNEAGTTSPADLQELVPCGGTVGDYNIDEETFAFLDVLDADGNQESADYAEVELPDPGDLESMPDAETAPTEPARGPDPIDTDSIEVPAPPD